MVNINFREANSADIPAMFVIRFAVTENVLSNPALVTHAMCEDYLDKLGRGWVAELDGKLIGFSYAANADNSIWALFVQPGYEGLGAGKGLLKLACDYLFQRGANEVHLGTQADTRADRFYLAQGWTRGEMKNEIEVAYTLSA